MGHLSWWTLLLELDEEMLDLESDETLKSVRVAAIDSLTVR